MLWGWVYGRGGLALSLWFACPAGGCVPRGWWVAVPGGWPPTVVRGVWCQALSLCRPPVPEGMQPGPAAHVSRARVAWAWGTRHRPDSVRSCEPALRAVGVAGGLSQGGCLAPLWGASGVTRSSSSAARPHRRLSGPAAHVLWARVCGRGGPALSPWLACPAGACVPRGLREAVPGGLAFRRCEGRLVSGAVPFPAAPPWGRAWHPGPVVRVSRARLVWTQHRPHSVRSWEPALRAVGVARGLPRGWCLAPLRGASEVRRSSSPDCPSSGLAVRVRYPRAVGADVRAWGPGTVP